MGLNIPKNKKDVKTKVDQYNYVRKKIYDIEMGWQDTWKKRRDEALNYKFKGDEFHDTTYPGNLLGGGKDGGISDSSRKDVIEYFDSVKPKVPKKPLYKINMADQREIKNIDMQEVPKKALPFGIRNDRYYTTERVGINTHTFPKGNDGLPLIKLKDQAGNIVFKGSQTEYNEKYGDALSPGTKSYGQKNLKRRLYPQGYTKK